MKKRKATAGGRKSNLNRAPLDDTRANQSHPSKEVAVVPDYTAAIPRNMHLTGRQG